MFVKALVALSSSLSRVLPVMPGGHEPAVRFLIVLGLGRDLVLRLDEEERVWMLFLEGIVQHRHVARQPGCDLGAPRLGDHIGLAGDA